MNEMEFDTIVRRVGIPQFAGIIRNLLQVGYAGDVLDLAIQNALETSADKANVARLNLVGGLRGLGYLVSGGRGGGGPFYKIYGWQQPPEPATTASWTPETQAKLAEIRNLPRITDAQEDWFYLHTYPRGDDTHENSWLYFRTYEMGGRNEAFVYEGSRGAAIVIQKFRDSPRFNILQLDCDPQSLAKLAVNLGEVSCAPVKIVNPRSTDLRGLARYLPRGRQVKYTQAIYDVTEIADTPETFWRHKTIRNMKSALSDTEFIAIEDGAVELQTTVINEWRKVNEPKQRQLAVRRDYIAAQVTSDKKIVVLGLRDRSTPVSVNVFDRIIGRPVVSHIVEKALNYSAMPGGRSGTSDLGMWQSCIHLSKLGVRYINGGMIDGGTNGLAEHKKHLACEIKTVVVFDTGERRQLSANVIPVPAS